MESSDEDEVEIVSWSVCRICLNSNAITPLESPVDTDETGNNTIYYSTLGTMLEKITGVNMAEGLPDVICSTCAGDLRVAIALRRRAKTSDRTLRTLLKKVSIMSHNANDFTDITPDLDIDAFETDETVRIYKKMDIDAFETDETVRIYKKVDIDAFETDETVRIYKKESNTFDANPETNDWIESNTIDANLETNDWIESNTIDANPETDDWIESNTIDANPETNDWITEYLSEDEETDTEQSVDENTCTSPANICEKPSVRNVKTNNEKKVKETKPGIRESDMLPIIEERITKTNIPMFDIAVQTAFSTMNEAGILKMSLNDEVVRVSRPSVSESVKPIKETRTQITEKAIQTIISSIYNKKFSVLSNSERKKNKTTCNRDNKKSTSLLDLLDEPNVKLSKIPVEPDFVDVTKPEIKLKPVSVNDVLKALGPDKLPLQHLKKIQQNKPNESQETPEELQEKPRDILAEAIKITGNINVSNQKINAIETPVFVDSIEFLSDSEVESQPTLEETLLESVENTAKKTVLKAPLNVHAAICPHPDCGRKFISNKYLLKHIKKCHKSVKPVGTCIYYLCVKCNTKNRTKSEAIQHMRKWHKNEKIIVKEIKGKPGSKLNQENGTKEIKLKRYKYPKRFQCDQCGYLTLAETKLLEHIRSKHTGEKPFRCPVCDKGFNTRYWLVRHRRTHYPDHERPFLCTICGKRFHHNKGLTTHMQRHSDDNYICQECGEQYDFKDNLDQHMKRDHGLYKFATCAGTYSLLPSTQPV